MQKAEAHILLIDVIFTKGKCTAEDLETSEDLEGMKIKTIQNRLKEMEKEGLVTIKQIENPIAKKKPRNEYSLKCPCPLPGETDKCNSCPSGRNIKAKIKALSCSTRT